MGKYDFELIVSKEQMQKNREKLVEDTIEYEVKEDKTIKRLTIVFFILVAIFFIGIAILTWDDHKSAVQKQIEQKQCIGNSFIGVCSGEER